MISDSSFATSSASPSPALREVDVEKAAKCCVLAGFHADCSRMVERAAGRLMVELVNLETVRGAERANARMDIMMMVTNWS